MTTGTTRIAGAMLAWYDRDRRDLPWRVAPGRPADPYRVWLSEVMLQQTTVAAVGPYYRRFLELWPDVWALAAAPVEEVLREWAGLGYYARARNLHACAQVVAGQLEGRFPDTEEGLRDLPGLGAYTAAAVAAIAFGRAATVVDGNVERVVARLFAVEEPLPGIRPRLRALAATLTPDFRPGDFAQAMMDLGATICTPRQPRCLVCPLRDSCAALAAGTAGLLPRKAAKAEKPTRYGVAFWLEDGKGSILLRRRPAHGLLGGMLEVPSTDWTEGSAPGPAALASQAPARADWRPLPGTVRHTFTHFFLELAMVTGLHVGQEPERGFWIPASEIGQQGLPTVMRKLVAHALTAGTGSPK